MSAGLFSLRDISEAAVAFREKSRTLGLLLLFSCAGHQMAWSQTALTNPANAQMDAANAQREKAVTAMSASIDRQKASVRRQKSAAMESGQPAGGASEVPAFFVTDALIQQAQSVADCDRLPAMQLEPLIARAARANQVSADLVRAVMRQESAFRPCAVSDKGAMGLMQLMPATATDLGVSDAFDPEENAFAGAKLLRSLMARYHGDLNRTLGAYNAGPANVDAADGPPDFPETTGYIDKITQALGISPASQ